MIKYSNSTAKWRHVTQGGSSQDPQTSAGPTLPTPRDILTQTLNDKILSPKAKLAKFKEIYAQGFNKEYEWTETGPNVDTPSVDAVNLQGFFDLYLASLRGEDHSLPLSTTTLSSETKETSEAKQELPDFDLVVVFLWEIHVLNMSAVYSSRISKQKPAGQQLAEAIFCRPANWVCLYTPDKNGFLPLHEAINRSLITSAPSLLRYAPYTQTHAEDQRKKKASGYAFDSETELLASHTKLADLVDLKIYLDKTFFESPKFMWADRKRLRVEAYLEIMSILKSYQQAKAKHKDSFKAALNAFITRNISEETQIATGLLRPDKTHTFLDLLNGLLINLDHVMQQYAEHEFFFQAYAEQLRPLAAMLQSGTPVAETHKWFDLLGCIKTAEDFEHFVQIADESIELSDLEIYQELIKVIQALPAETVATISELEFTQNYLRTKLQRHDKALDQGFQDHDQGYDEVEYLVKLAIVLKDIAFLMEFIKKVTDKVYPPPAMNAMIAAKTTCFQAFENYIVFNLPTAGTIVKLALLYEEAHPLSGLQPQSATTFEHKAESKDSLCLPKLPVAVLVSPEFQNRTLTVLTEYLCRRVDINAGDKKDVVMLVNDRVKALLSPYPIQTPPKLDLCASSAQKDIAKKIIAIWNIKEFLDEELYLTLFKIIYADKWPMNGGTRLAEMLRDLDRNLASWEREGFDQWDRQDLEVLNEGILSFKPLYLGESHVFHANKFLGKYASEWSLLHKLYLGYCPIINVSSWQLAGKLSRFSNDTMLASLTDSSPAMKFTHLKAVVEFFWGKYQLTPETAKSCRKAMAKYSRNALAEAQKELRKIEIDTKTIALESLYHLALALQDDNLLRCWVQRCNETKNLAELQRLANDPALTEQQKLEIFSKITHLLTDASYALDIIAYFGSVYLKLLTDKGLSPPLIGQQKNSDLLNFFIRYEQKFPALHSINPVNSMGEEKSTATSLSCALVEVIFGNTPTWAFLPQYWRIIYSLDKQGSLPLHAAIEVGAGDVIFKLLSQMPYTQTHTENEKGQKAKAISAAYRQTIEPYEKRADLLDLKVYIYDIIIANKKAMMDDRKLLRGKTYLEIMSTLEDYADESQDKECIEQIAGIIVKKIAAEKQIERVWDGWFNSNSTFIDILQGLKNQDLLPQYRRYRDALKAHAAMLQPEISKLEPKSKSKPQAANQARFSSVISSPAPSVQNCEPSDDNDPYDESPLYNLTKSNQSFTT